MSNTNQAADDIGDLDSFGIRFTPTQKTREIYNLTKLILRFETPETVSVAAVSAAESSPKFMNVLIIDILLIDW